MECSAADQPQPQPCAVPVSQPCSLEQNLLREAARVVFARLFGKRRCRHVLMRKQTWGFFKYRMPPRNPRPLILLQNMNFVSPGWVVLCVVRYLGHFGDTKLDLRGKKACDGSSAQSLEAARAYGYDYCTCLGHHLLYLSMLHVSHVKIVFTLSKLRLRVRYLQWNKPVESRRGSSTGSLRSAGRSLTFVRTQGRSGPPDVWRFPQRAGPKPRGGRGVHDDVRIT